MVVAAVSVGLNTDISSVPRFDGAGYAVLGDAFGAGRGYCEINNPRTPPHDHFPPGYPLALAILWKFTGRSVEAAHLFSVVCTVLAVLLGWGWFRAMYPPRTALILGLALAINWTWGRIGGSIQSEPFFMVWELLTILAAIQAARHGTFRNGVGLGLALGAAILTRHVGICITVAVLLNLHRASSPIHAGFQFIRAQAPFVVRFACLPIHGAGFGDDGEAAWLAAAFLPDHTQPRIIRGENTSSFSVPGFIFKVTPSASLCMATTGTGAAVAVVASSQPTDKMVAKQKTDIFMRGNFVKLYVLSKIRRKPQIVSARTPHVYSHFSSIS